MAPRISVIMPTFKRPHLLVQALTSLREQTMADFEALICDNAADEDTRSSVAQFDDHRFRYIPRSQNLGLLRNAILGFAEARAPVVMKLDDDDVLVADALERLVHPFNAHPDVTLSFGGVLPVDPDLRTLTDVATHLDRTSGRSWFPEGLIRPATWLVARGGVQLAGAALRRSAVDWLSIPDEVATAYDLHLCLVATQDEQATWFSRPPVVRYRIHEQNDTSTNFARQVTGATHALELALASGRHGDEEALKRRLASTALVAGRARLHAGEHAAARSLLRRSLELQPTSSARRLLALANLPSSMTGPMLAAKGSLTRGRTA